MVVGIVPMGGRAERWRPIPCPKELLPFGLDGNGRPRVIGDYVMERMIAADVERVIVPIRPEKATFVMDFFGDRLANGAPLIYFAAPGPDLLADLQACVPLIQQDQVLFGMPDTYFRPDSAFRDCLNLLGDGAELALGCFPHGDPTDLDVIERNDHYLTGVWPKPHHFGATPNEIWGIACWTQAFTERLANYNPPPGERKEGYLFHQVAQAGFARCTVFANDSYVDLGSYRIYEQAIARLHQERQ